MFYFWPSLYAFSSNKCHHLFMHSLIIKHLERLITLSIYDTRVILKKYIFDLCFGRSNSRGNAEKFGKDFWAPGTVSVFRIRYSRSERRTQNNKQNNKRGAPKPKCRSRKSQVSVSCSLCFLLFFGGRPCGYSLSHCLHGALHCLQEGMGKLWRLVLNLSATSLSTGLV